MNREQNTAIKPFSPNINNFNFSPQSDIDQIIYSELTDNKIRILEKLLFKDFKTGEIYKKNAFKTYKFQSKTTYGENTYKTLKRPPTFLFLVKENFKDPILLTLAGLSLLSASVCIIKGIINKKSISPYDFIDSIVILIGISILGVYGAWSDYKFSREDEKIDIIEFQYPLFINNTMETCLAADLVVGDLIIINAGDEIPADCLILPYLEQNTKIEVDESIITGEKDGIEKGIYDILLAGTYCLSGIAKCLVFNVGMNTKKGKIMQKLNEEENLKNDYLHMKASSLLQKIIRITCLISGFLLVGNIVFNIKNIKHNGFIVIVNFIMEIISFAALAIPEGLPFCLTLVISSSRSILFNGDVSVKVKTKKALDSLISLKVLCFDKTGTLTHNILKLININFQVEEDNVELKDNMFSEEFNNLNLNIPILRQEYTENILTTFMQKNITYKLEYLKHLYTLRINLIINNQAVIANNKGFMGNKLDMAILKNFKNQEIILIREKYKQLRIIPLSSKTKCMISIIRIPEEDIKIFSDFKYIILFKGALELLNNYKNEPTVDSLEDICIRKIGCAWIPIINIKTLINLTDEELIKYISNSVKMNVSFLNFEDPLRIDAKESIAIIKDAGIQCIVVTGDSIESGILCAKKIGLLINPVEICPYKRTDRTKLIEIDDIAIDSSVFRNLTIHEIRIILPKLRVLSRCTPEDKKRLIKILQDCNTDYSIGICGDGINDSMAMKKADLSFSFSNCTSQIPKNAASIILEKSYLKGIVKALKISRSSLRNLRGFLQFQISVAASIVAVSIISIFLKFNKPENKRHYAEDYMPEFMTSIEILWLNFFIDALSCFFFSNISSDNSLLKRDPEIRSYNLILYRMERCIKFNAFYNLASFLILHLIKFDRIICLLNFLNNVLIMSIFSHKIYANDNILKNFLKNWLSIVSVLFYFIAQLILTVVCTDYFGYKLSLFDLLLLSGLLIFGIFIRITFVLYTNKIDTKK